MSEPDAMTDIDERIAAAREQEGMQMRTNDVVERRIIKGTKVNFNRDAEIDVFGDGTVRIQQEGHPVDVVLLTARQVRAIAMASERARQP